MRKYTQPPSLEREMIEVEPGRMRERLYWPGNSKQATAHKYDFERPIEEGIVATIGNSLRVRVVEYPIDDLMWCVIVERHGFLSTMLWPFHKFALRFRRSVQLLRSSAIYLLEIGGLAKVGHGTSPGIRNINAVKWILDRIRRTK